MARSWNKEIGTPLARRCVTRLQLKTVHPSSELRLGMWAIRLCHSSNCGSNIAFWRVTTGNGVAKKYLWVSGMGSSFLRMPHVFRPTSYRHFARFAEARGTGVRNTRIRKPWILRVVNTDVDKYTRKESNLYYFQSITIVKSWNEKKIEEIRLFSVLY